MAIDTTAKVLAALGSTPHEIVKIAWSGEGAGTWFSLWRIAGEPSAAVAPPLFTAGAGYVPTKATLGAIPITDAPGGQTQHVLRAALVNTTTLTAFLADRLWHCSGLLTNTTSLQSITTPGALPSGRVPSPGRDVMPYLEVNSPPGATGPHTWEVVSTDAAGNANRTWTYTHPANAESTGQMMRLMPGGSAPAATVAMSTPPVSFQSSGNSGTAGDVGIVLARTVTTFRIGAANVVDLQDVLATGKQRVYDDACLFLRVLCSATAAGVTEGTIELGSG
jgi:hypothetical protein